MASSVAPISSNRLICEIWICKAAGLKPDKTDSRLTVRSHSWCYAEPWTCHLRLEAAFDLAWRVSLVQKVDLCLVQGLQFIASILLEA
jgi:hypothetical protein